MRRTTSEKAERKAVGMIPKFRGMLLSGEWVIGNLTIIPKTIDVVEEGYYISNKVGMPFAFKVRPETVGMSTGREDKHGVEIFEGDIVRFSVFNYYGDQKNSEMIGVVSYYKCDACFIVENDTDYWEGKELSGIFSTMTVIGNTHEHPELLKEKP